MRKLVIALCAALSLAACTTTDFTTGFSNVVTAATVGVQNPVTRNDLYAFENSMIVAFAGLNAYKKTCAQGAVDANCRANIAKLQVYTRKIPQVLADARVFVKNNDQVNAQVAYSTAKQLYADFTALAAASNIKVQ